MARLITVFGATGRQGAPIVNALLQKGFKVRAVTRNPGSEKAKILKAAGADTVKGDLNDAATIQTAVHGAYGVFVVTDFWELFQQNKETAFDGEVAQGKAVADACKEAGVEHVVYSGLDSVKDAIGKFCAPLDSKAAVEKYLDQIGVPNTSVRYPFYFENFLVFLPQKQEDGTFVMTWPADGPMYAISVEDGGPIVASIFSNPGEFIGKKIGIATDNLTMHDYAAMMSKATGKTIKYNQVSPDVYAQFPFPQAEALAVMFEFFKSGKMQRDVNFTRQVNPNAQNFEKWAVKNKDKLLEKLSAI